MSLTPEQAHALLQGCSRLRAAFPEWIPAAADQTRPLLEAAAVIAHWTLGALTEVRGFLHDAGARDDGNVIRLWIGFHHAPTAHAALQLACQILVKAMAGQLERAAWQQQLDALWAQCRMHHPDYQTRILMAGAREAGIPVLPLLRAARLWQYGWGVRSRFFLESSSNADSFLGATLQRSKTQTKALFTRLGLPTPRATRVARLEDLQAAAQSIGWPCVLKPEDKGGGKGVTANIRTLGELESAFAHARTFSDQPLLMEAHLPGEDHRLMLLDGRLHAASQRRASWVTGDGERTVAALLMQLNGQRSTNMVKSRYLRPIPMDEVLGRHLASQGLELRSVPAAGRRVSLRSNANLSTGGTCIDVTELVHPSTRHLAEMFAKTLGLRHMGLDYITTDISRSWQEGGGFIEANATPGLDAIVAAGHDPVKIALAVLGDQPGRIPVRIAIVADEDVAQAASDLRSRTLSPQSGWVCTGQGQVGPAALDIPMPTIRAAAQALLVNQAVEDAFIVCAVSELLRDGLPVDRADAIALCGSLPGLTESWLRVLETQAKVVRRQDSWSAFFASEPAF